MKINVETSLVQVYKLMKSKPMNQERLERLNSYQEALKHKTNTINTLNKQVI